MSQYEEQIKQVEITLEESQKLSDRGKQVQKLLRNKDFQKIVDEGYFKEEAARLALLLSDPVMIMHDQTKFIQNDILGIGSFKRYLETIIKIGRNMDNEMEGHNQTLEELRAEEYDEQTRDLTSDDIEE